MKQPRVIDVADGPLFPIEECRAQVRVIPTLVDSDGNVSSDDDASILGFLAAAVDAAEDFTGLCILVRTYEIALDSFQTEHRRPWTSAWVARTPEHRIDASAIEIPVTPLIEVVSVIYGSDTDTFELLPEIDFTVDTFATFARLLPTAGWPAVSPASNNVRIVVRAGFIADSDGNNEVPGAIKQAILLMMGDWFRSREDSADRQQFQIPNSAQALLRPKRVRLGMA